MRRSVAVIISVVALLWPMSPIAEATQSRTTYVMADCLHLRIAPRGIVFACADRNYYVDHLKWTRWHVWRAAGYGLFHQNDCRPNCAEGTFHTTWGFIWLRNRDGCAPRRFAFQHVRVRYRRRLLGHRVNSFGHLGCP
jgi:hypothetical protein